ncbi:response regulator [Methylomonas sp. EFPC1]|uniref:Response regulator n=1 Tax=Methylomonas defluvii TaxID=3045149 RepID=A0ABU4U9S1_9GAMM|nr:MULTISPECIES: response regulator [unclassified Methylomonas]MDX8125757.1 response regulator [Methylomonas sp. OY6]QSB01874.1 response regulator [Methylomonas sp. EFPC1]
MTVKNCLIVDDSKMSRMMVKKIILDAHPDWILAEAQNGQEAIDRASEAGFDIILLDYNMPVMEGGAAAAVIRPLQPEAQIAFLTANVQEAVKNLAIQLRIDFIPKPITEEKIKRYVG